VTKEELVGLLVDLKWEWAEHEENGIKGVAFKKTFNGNEVKYHFSNAGIERATREQIEKALKAYDVTWMTRIVGYYSRVSNWNKSKIGELKDRQEGSYVI
jgi:hypothetical protein